MSTLTISQCLRSAEAELSTVSDSVKLDAEILLAHILKSSRSHLHAWPEKFLTVQEAEQYKEFLKRRLSGEPIAYIIGHKEFWSLDFLVTRDTLIPRPETELLIERVLQLLHEDDACCVADLGTGTGAIAIALAHTRPRWEIHATDASLAALKVATENARRLAVANVFFHQGNWCQALPQKTFAAILANPPYLALNDPHLRQGDLCFEPESALASGADGLNAIREIVAAVPTFLKSGGYLLLEHGYDQAQAVEKILLAAGFKEIKSERDLANHTRIMQAQFY